MDIPMDKPQTPDLKPTKSFLHLHARDIHLQEGIQDMVRVDHGAESYLLLFVQNLLRDERGNVTCEPYLQTRSWQVRHNNTGRIVYILWWNVVNTSMFGSYS